MRIQRRYNLSAPAVQSLRVRTSNGTIKTAFVGGLPGQAHVLVLGFLMVAFVIGGYHLYSVNQSAVQGYHMRSVEKEIALLKEENAELKIVEADLRSLQRIETASQDLKMEQSVEVKYLEARGPVAMR